MYAGNAGEAERLIEHPLISLFLAGHPQAISLAAPMLMFKSLSQLFKEFLKNDFKALNYEESETAQKKSLEASLKISIEAMANQCPEALVLFKFMSMFPTGVNSRDLE